MPKASRTALIIKSNGIGEGEIDLGAGLMRSCLNVLLEQPEVPERVIFLNSGVFLTTAGSDVLETVRALERAGAEILSCGTCLDYYGRKGQLEVGSATDMKVTVATMLEYDKVITL
jgi:selenium metabolism protein YedF